MWAGRRPYTDRRDTTCLQALAGGADESVPRENRRSAAVKGRSPRGCVRPRLVGFKPFFAVLGCEGSEQPRVTHCERHRRDGAVVEAPLGLFDHRGIKVEGCDVAGVKSIEEDFHSDASAAADSHHLLVGEFPAGEAAEPVGLAVLLVRAA